MNGEARVDGVLDVNGNASVSGTLSVGSSATPWEIFEDANGDLYIKKGSQHFIGFGAASVPDTIYFLVATANYSDKALKGQIQDIPSADATAVLRSVNAKTYVRTDLDNSLRRAGFLADDFEGVPSGLGSNIVSYTSDGTKTLDYHRVSTILWAACQHMLTRIEALEAAAAS